MLMRTGWLDRPLHRITHCPGRRLVTSADARNRLSPYARIMRANTTHIETLVIGGGQAGLAVGYHLAKRGLPFLILDASQRTGDAWRNRWDSLRLFNPARYAGLPGVRFPARGDSFPTKEQMADYLADYSKRFLL